MADTVQFRADDRLSAALQAEVARTGNTISDVVRGPLTRAYATDRPVYGVGSGVSLVGDSWTALSGNDAEANPDAFGRITRFRAQLADGTAWAAFGLHTGNISQIVAPAYEPLLVAVEGATPLWDLTTSRPLTNANPFTIPGRLSTTGTTGVHVENVNPSAGTTTFTGGAINPSGRSGIFDVTRELLDSSNPAIDEIVLSAMVEDFAAQLEVMVTTELAVLTASATVAAAVVPATLRTQIGRMMGARRRRASAAVVSAADAIIDACDLLPAANSGSAIGFNEITGDNTAQWKVQGVPINTSADLGSTSGQVVAAVVSPESLWSWTTGPRQFRFEQVSGPGIIRLAIHGYAAVEAVRPAGIRTVKLT